jgi:glucan exporter ATP-binding protein
MSLPRLYARVLGLLGVEANIAILIILSNVLLAGVQFSESILFGRIVNEIATAGGGDGLFGWGNVVPLGLVWTGLGLFSIGLHVFVALNADRVSHKRRLSVMADYFEHVLHLPMSFHTKAQLGRLMKVMLDGSNALQSLWLQFLRERSASFAALVVMLPLSLFINWRLGLLLLALVFFFGLTMLWVVRKTETLQSKVEGQYSELAERASDTLGNIPVVQSFTRVETEAFAMREMVGRVLSAQLPVLSWWAVAAVATQTSVTLTLLSILLLGLFLNMHGLATLSEIVTFMVFATGLIDRLQQIVAYINEMLMQAPKLEELFKVLDTESVVRDAADASDVGRLDGHVRFENVTFSYDSRRDAVSGVSFEASPGEVIALVGATGSGKSTTLSLLHRVFDPQNGRILIDGRDIRTMTVASLRRNIGVVFQEPMLFARSIQENLRVGKVDASKAQIALALRRSQAADFVARQPEGLATVIGERGRTLSGGERQRLSIARALLKDPPIMIYDEATSALDAATERQIQSALEAATAGRTTFVIAHRLATVRNATRILVFDEGRVIESGTFQELVAINGRFAELARAQFMTEAAPPLPPDKAPA